MAAIAKKRLEKLEQAAGHTDTPGKREYLAAKDRERARMLLAHLPAIEKMGLGDAFLPEDVRRGLYADLEGDNPRLQARDKAIVKRRERLYQEPPDPEIESRLKIDQEREEAVRMSVADHLREHGQEFFEIQPEDEGEGKSAELAEAAVFWSEWFAWTYFKLGRTQFVEWCIKQWNLSDDVTAGIVSAADRAALKAIGKPDFYRFLTEQSGMGSKQAWEYLAELDSFAEQKVTPLP